MLVLDSNVNMANEYECIIPILPYLSPAPGTISLGGSRVSCSFLLSRSTSERGMSTLKGTMSESAMFVDGLVCLFQ
jgi:hypothetical protein